jgi:hypothetical protein
MQQLLPQPRIRDQARPQDPLAAPELQEAVQRGAAEVPPAPAPAVALAGPEAELEVLAGEASPSIIRPRRLFCPYPKRPRAFLFSGVMQKPN